MTTWLTLAVVATTLAVRRKRPARATNPPSDPTVDVREFDIGSSIGDEMRSFALRAGPRVELVHRIAPDVPRSVTGDDGTFRRIVANLLANAIPFTTDGEIVVDVSVAEPGTDDVLLHVTVHDTGTADHQRALALTLSRPLTARLGGRLWVETRVGTAVHFTARFRIRPSFAPERVLAGRSVLVVGDNAAVRSMLSEALREAGAAVRVVSDAAEGLQAFQNAMPPFSAVVADATMPEMDGFELLARLRCSPAPPLGVLLLSARTGMAQVARCRRAGITVFRTKPLVSHELVWALAGGLERSGHPCGS